MKLPLSCVRFGGAFVVVASMTIVSMAEAVLGSPFIASSPLSQSQTPSASTPRFEVASIKPAAPDAPRPGRVAYAVNGARINTDPGLVSIRSISRRDHTAAATGEHAHHIAGGTARV